MKLGNWDYFIIIQTCQWARTKEKTIPNKIVDIILESLLLQMIRMVDKEETMQEVNQVILEDKTVDVKVLH